MNQTQKNLMNATMDIIAEVGLDGFSMKQVTDRVGVTTAVVYQYFGTKEALLYQCFLQINQEIGEHFSESKLPANATKEELIGFLHDEWVRYFLMLLHGGKKTLFYYAYRDSTYLEKILIRNNQEIAEALKNFSAIFQNFSDKFRLTDKIDMDYFWVYLLDGTGVFAKRIITRNIPVEMVNIEQIWTLLLSGISSLLS